MKASKGREMKRKVSEAADTSPISPDNEKVILKLQLEIARLSVDNKKLIEVNKMCAEQLKEQSRLFQNAGQCVAVCHSCHGLASRLHRMKLAEAGGGTEQEEEDE